MAVSNFYTKPFNSPGAAPTYFTVDPDRCISGPKPERRQRADGYPVRIGKRRWAVEFDELSETELKAFLDLLFQNKDTALIVAFPDETNPGTWKEYNAIMKYPSWKHRERFMYMDVRIDFVILDA